MKLCHLWKIQKLPICLLSTQKGSKMSLLLLYRQRFPRYGPIFKNALLRMKLGDWWKIEELHIWSLSTPGGWNWAYFPSTGSGFQDMGRFSKLPFWGMKLGHWPKFQKLHIYPLSTPGGRNWAYFCSTGSGFRDMGPFSKLSYLGMKLGCTAGHFQDIGNFSLPQLATTLNFNCFFFNLNLRNFCEDCQKEHSENVWLKKSNNCRRCSVLKFSLP